MFRRLSNSLPEDPKFPADLESLGYYINDNDQIRSIANPDQEFNFFISKNDRVNDTQREAMNTCIRHIVLSRLATVGLSTFRLPLHTPARSPHIPILASPTLSTAKRVIVFVGEAMQDLGIFAYRLIGQKSINHGSAVELVQRLQDSIDDESIGLIIANMGQLIWYRGGKRAVTHATWQALPRKTGVAGPMRLDEVANRVPGNESVEAHVKCVFEEMVRRMARKDAVLDVVGLGAGANEVATYLDRHWDQWKGRIQAVVLGAPQMYVKEYGNEEFREFLGKRGRAYLLSKEPIDTPLSGREDYGCDCYSSGEALYTECIMPVAKESILRYFDLMEAMSSEQPS